MKAIVPQMPAKSPVFASGLPYLLADEYLTKPIIATKIRNNKATVTFVKEKNRKSLNSFLPVSRSPWNTAMKAHAITAESQRRENINTIAAIIESSNPTNTGSITILKFAASSASDMSLEPNDPLV